MTEDAPKGTVFSVAFSLDGRVDDSIEDVSAEDEARCDIDGSTESGLEEPTAF
jgi:hypothetical protein